MGGASGGDFAAFDATHVKGILVHIGSYSGGPSPGVEDSESNANWVEVTPRTSGEVRDVWWWNDDPSTAADLVVSVVGSGSYTAAEILYLGAPGALELLDEDGATGSLQPGPITPPRNGCLVAAGASGNNGFNDPISVDDGFTLAASEPYENGANEGAAAAYIVQTTAGAADPEFSIGGTPSGKVSSLVVIGVVAGNTTITPDVAATGVGARGCVRLGAAAVGVGAAHPKLAIVSSAAALGLDAESADVAWATTAAAAGVGASGPRLSVRPGVAGTGVGARGPVVSLATAPAGLGVGAVSSRLSLSPGFARTGVAAVAPRAVLRLDAARVGLAAALGTIVSDVSLVPPDRVTARELHALVVRELFSIRAIEL